MMIDNSMNTLSSLQFDLPPMPSLGVPLTWDLRTASSTSPGRIIMVIVIITTIITTINITSPNLPASSTASLLRLAQDCEKLWCSTSPLSKPHHLQFLFGKLKPKLSRSLQKKITLLFCLLFEIDQLITVKANETNTNVPISIFWCCVHGCVLAKVGHPAGEAKVDQVLLDQIFVPETAKLLTKKLT